MLGLCARRPALRRLRSAGGDVLLLARSKGEHPQAIWPDIPGSSRPTPLTDIASSTSPSEILDLSGKRPVGPTPGARSSPWPILRRTPGARRPERRRSHLADRDRDRAPHRRAVRDRALDQRPKPRPTQASASRRARRWSPIFKPTCASSAPSSPKRDTTKAINYCSAAGMHSPASSMTGACACPTMPPSASYGRSRCLSHCAFLLQVSVNIGSVLVSSTRHGRPFRATADLTESDAKSSARIWYGAPATTCTAGSTLDLISRRTM